MTAWSQDSSIVAGAIAILTHDVAERAACLDLDRHPLVVVLGGKPVAFRRQTGVGGRGGLQQKTPRTHYALRHQNLIELFSKFSKLVKERQHIHDLLNCTILQQRKFLHFQ